MGLNEFIANGQLYSPDEGGAPADGNAPEGNTSSTATTADPPKERSFTEDQVNKIVQERLERERSKGKKDKDSVKSEILAEWGITNEDEALEAKDFIRNKAEIEQRKREERGEYEKNLAEKDKKHQEEVSRYKGESSEWKGKYESYYKNDQLTTTGLRIGADPESIAVLVKYAEDSIQVGPDGHLQVVDYRGEVRHDPDDLSKEMTIETRLGELLREFPKLQKSSGTQGAGSNSSRGTNGYTKEQILDLAKNNIKKYAELKEDGTVDAVLNSD